MVLRGELNQSTPRLNIYFMGALIARLSEAMQAADQHLRNDFQQFLRDFKNHPNQIIQEAIARASKSNYGGYKPSVPANYSVHSGEFTVANNRELQALSESAPALEAGVSEQPVSAMDARNATISSAQAKAQALHVPKQLAGSGIGISEAFLKLKQQRESVW